MSARSDYSASSSWCAIARRRSPWRRSTAPAPRCSISAPTCAIRGSTHSSTGTISSRIPRSPSPKRNSASRPPPWIAHSESQTSGGRVLGEEIGRVGKLRGVKKDRRGCPRTFGRIHGHSRGCNGYSRGSTDIREDPRIIADVPGYPREDAKSTREDAKLTREHPRHPREDANLTREDAKSTREDATDIPENA